MTFYNIYVYIYIYIHNRMYVYTYPCMYVCVHISVYGYMNIQHLHPCIFWQPVSLYICVSVYVYTCLCLLSRHVKLTGTLVTAYVLGLYFQEGLLALLKVFSKCDDFGGLRV